MKTIGSGKQPHTVLWVVVCIVISCLMVSPAWASEVLDIEAADFFQKQEGTFLLRELETGKTYIYNEKRASTRMAPQSTFKVMNALIGLQVNAVTNENTLKKWTGQDYKMDVWNRDHTLASAMRVSAIWYYQAMARDIGEQRMQEWLETCAYGNHDITGGIDHFWLNSSLEISPVEQLNFMERLYREELPFDIEVMKTVKKIMLQEKNENYALYGKTGSGSNGLGWFVGFVETGDKTYVFVANLTAGEWAGGTAKAVAVDILKQYGILNSTAR